jgi:hypothetical protein
MAEVLKGCGFTVTELENANRPQMREAIRAFGARIAEGAVGCFYFAGHGLQVKGHNYLVPVGADIASEDEVAEEAVAVDGILARMEAAKNQLNLLILDACRNHPLGKNLPGVTAGLAQMKAPAGCRLAFAAAPGKTVPEGSGGTDWYTSALLQQLRASGLSLPDVFKRTRAEVLRASNQAQAPWEAGAAGADFLLRPGPGPERAPLATSAVDDAPAPLPEGADPLDILPRPVLDLEKGKSFYRQTGIANHPGFDITKTIEEKDGAWCITTETRSPAYELNGVKLPPLVVTDVALLGKGSFTYQKHTMSTLQKSETQILEDVDYRGGKVSGFKNFQGELKPVSLDCGFAFFCGMPDCVGRLPR